MEGCDTVVNFAAETHVDRSLLGDASFIETDVRGVFVLLEEAKRRGVSKFIQISTDEVYGTIAAGSFTEESPLNPRNPYAASKAGGDRLAYSYWASYGMPVVITRASNNYGPYQYPEKLIPLFVTNAIDDQPLPLYGDGRNVRDWLFVRDHAAAIDFLLDAGQARRDLQRRRRQRGREHRHHAARAEGARQAREPDPLRRRPARARPPLLARRVEARASSASAPRRPSRRASPRPSAGTGTTRSGGVRSRSGTRPTASSTGRSTSSAWRRRPRRRRRRGSRVPHAGRRRLRPRQPHGGPRRTPDRPPRAAPHSRDGLRRNARLGPRRPSWPPRATTSSPGTKAELDIADSGRSRARLRELQPDVVVNCAAFTKVDDCETDPRAFQVNAEGRRASGRRLRSRRGAARADLDRLRLRRRKGRAVPGGRLRCTHSRPTGGPSAPGKRRRCACPGASSSAPPGSSGARGWNFVEAILKQVEAGRAAALGRRRPGRPPDVDDRPLGGASWRCWRRAPPASTTSPTAGEVSWNEFAREILWLAGRMDVPVDPTTSEAFARPARRPPYSVLDTGKYERLTGRPIRHFRDPLAEYLARRARPEA